MRGIEQIPALYDAGLGLLEATGLGRWRLWLASGAKGRTLDLGCGTGRNLPLFGSDVQSIGLDPCIETLQAARRRRPEVPLVLGAAERLPFHTGTFDTVVSGLVFCSVSEPPRSFGEVRRVLAPGGSLRMLEHVRATTRLHARLQDALQPLWTRFTGGCRPNRDTEAALLSAQFRVEKTSRRASGTMRRLVARP
ncbi:MAG TPA: class I SAM-dependent methyltransferase [Thermoanaerobaculia bacterium]|nr:class I SAM-dependent methyltransferase [Thermoanaerobaculia bacterium]